jgi:adenosylmethionine-8-amino-7-oxononanoate aminotransferase
MNELETHNTLVAADRAHAWHPFTHMAEWCAPEHDPLMLVSGEGALLRDSLGREYVDGNSSIWTNLHGHRHPRLDAALQGQLGRVAHTSFLGFSNPPAAQLAKELVEFWPPGTLSRVFFSDDGSTAVEVALKIAAQYWQQSGAPRRQKFVAFSGAYHGDTMGASSLGGIGTFHERFAAWQFPVVRAETMDDLNRMDASGLAAVIIEPLIQGANQMRLWPAGMLRELRSWCDRSGVLLILDEVMTGFGRTGTMFACEREGVVPDLIALAKGLTGGYLPLAATMTAERIYEAFLGGPEKTLYYGHSYTGNQLACAVALENLAIFREERVLEGLQAKIALMRDLLEAELRPLPFVHEIRQCGFIAGIELRQADGERFPAERRVGTQICLAARAHGLLTRPILDTFVLLPPYCITEAQLRKAVRAVRLGIEEVCGGG